MMRAIGGAVVTVAAGALLLPVLDWVDVDARTGANALIVTIASLAGVFTLLYGLRSHWTATHAGRAVLYMSTALTLFGAQVSVSAWSGSDYPWRNEIRWILYFALAVTLANLIRTLLREQRRDGGD
ncbi:hypothetical protein [Gordonia sp. NB41Y]|uniref:putative phage holin n=1 Tax=Gordonia sp. NB41Y TaxID=875808 RepID=UPI0002C00192|nr:hypothetical protein [Gordonia sp. NB41Y]WLP90267.1 hypothetical protein Q9K23_22580 [Gordonia sp. NB41Y]